VESSSQNQKTNPDNVRKYFREVMEKHRLPPFPVVASKVLAMIDDPDLNIRQICRVLSDDSALATRVLSISRSAYYGQRVSPKNLQDAVKIVGFRTLRTLVITASTQGLFTTNNTITERLWSHSLAVALTARILSERVGYKDDEQAFLAGLLHDVGEMILYHGDPKGFERLIRGAEASETSLLQREKEIYSFDHAFIGFTLLDCWNIDPEIGQAVLKHHEDREDQAADELATIIASADCFSFRAELGFLSEPPAPRAEVLKAYGVDGDESLESMIQEVRDGFNAESALFKTL
jgi:putative nucleotidyltransferase with HDIG domain